MTLVSEIVESFLARLSFLQWLSIAAGLYGAKLVCLPSDSMTATYARARYAQ